MQPISFIAGSAEEAIAQIRARLGPEAVVLNVRPLPVNGLARLWQKPMIEVLAYKPEALPPQAAPDSDVLAEFRQQLHEIKQQVESRATNVEIDLPGSVTAMPASAPDTFECDAQAVDNARTHPRAVFPKVSALRNDHWRVGEVLQKGGLLPLHAEQVMEQLCLQHGEHPPKSLGEEIQLTQAVLAKAWRKPPTLSKNSLHVLVGSAGSGKTTCLCKWLTQAALVEGRRTRVWRLDGATANMAESLSVYCEILGVPNERAWQAGDETVAEDIGFIDLPGVDWRNPMAIKELAGQLKQLGAPRVHLVLNGAYETAVLLAQARAFGALPVEDLTITHLDEEARWGKIWNLVLGTNYSVRHLSTGQNIPGDFCEASAGMIFSRQFPCKQRVS